MRHALVLIAIFLSISVIAQEQPKSVPIDDTELTPGFHRLFVHNRVSVLVYVSDEGLFVTDAGYKSTAEALSAKLDSLSDQPIRYLFNTHIHGDHTGGNLLLGSDALIIAHDNVRNYLSVEHQRGDRVIEAFPEAALPKITFNDKMNMYFGDQEIQFVHLPGGHTNSDAVVYFPKAKIMHVGDMLFADNFPYVDTGNGGNPLKYIENVDYIINNYPADVLLVGGHGPVYTMKQYGDWNNNLKKTLEIIRKHKKSGMTQDEMKEKRVLKDWESYGQFFITEDRWIDIVFPYL